LLECLLTGGHRVYLLVSKAAQVVIGMETDLDWPAGARNLQEKLCRQYQVGEQRLKVCSENEWAAPIASGSSSTDAMVICPCSMGTLSSVAVGASANLMERAADVILKERKPFILVPRETPFSEIHLENMLKLARMGAMILPANPGFYNKPECVSDMIDFIVARVLGHLGLEQELQPKWGEPSLK
jgi:4-hydroxy-3-polyprenylbenzoate decarboxylase